MSALAGWAQQHVFVAERLNQILELTNHFLQCLPLVFLVNARLVHCVC